MAATKALDALFHVDPPPAAKKLRELFYSIFYATDHTTHFYALGGPDFVVGPDAPPAERNILGVVEKVGMDVAGKVLKMRRDGHAPDQDDGRPPRASQLGPARRRQPRHQRGAAQGDRELAAATPSSSPSSRCKLFDDVVLANTDYVEADHRRRLRPPHLQHGHGRRATTASTSTTARSASPAPTARSTPSTTPRDYREYVAERVEPWSLPEVPLPEEGRLEGLRRRRRTRASTRPRRCRAATPPTAWPRRWPRPSTSGSTRPWAASRSTTRWPRTGPG